MSAVDTPAVLSSDNPLARESDLPFELPPFGAITVEHCREALLAGMAEQRSEVAAIVGAEDPPTFENTVVALERSGRLLGRAWAVFGNLASSVSTPRMREIEREIAPLEAAHDDALRLDPALFAPHRRRARGAARPRSRRRGGPAGRALPPRLRAGRRPPRRAPAARG